MKFCIVTQQLGKIITGPGLYANNLVNSLVNDGHQVSVLAPGNQRPPGKLPYEFISIKTPQFSQSQARWLPLAFEFGNTLKNLQNKHSFSLLHFTDAREYLFTPRSIPAVGNINDTYSADLRPIQYYKKYYSDWWLRWVYYFMTNRLEQIALRRLDGVIANSQYTAGIVKKNYKIKDGNLFTCYKSVQVDEWRERVIQKRKPHNGSSYRILFVGTNMQRKGLPTLILAAPQVIKQFPNVEFCIIGHDKVVPEMKNLCQRVGVENNFNFLGWQPQSELPEYYANSSIFVMPSLTEALGVVILEAQAAGLPVIATRVGGIPEIIQDGENGILVDPDSPEQLAGAIVRLLTNADLVESIINNAFLRLEPFSLKSMMNQTYQIYQSVINK